MFIRNYKEQNTTQFKTFEYIPYYKPYIKNIISVILFMGILSIFGILFPTIQKILFDDILVMGNMKYLFYILILILILEFVQSSIDFIQKYILNVIKEKVDFEIKMNFIHHILKLPLYFFNNMPVGELIRRIGDSSVIQGYINIIVVDLISNLIKIIVFGIYMFVISWQLSLLTIILSPLELLWTKLFSKKYREYEQKTFDMDAIVQSQMFEMFSGIRVIKGFTSEEIALRSLKYNILKAREIGMESNVFIDITNRIKGFIYSIVNKLSFIFGVYLIFHRQITIGEFFAFQTVSGYFLGPLQGIYFLYYHLQGSSNAFRRYDTIKNLPQEMYKKGITINKNGFKGNIEFKNVWFGYNPENPVIRNCNFFIRENSTVALVGKSGSGKSTIINMIMGFYLPISGEILIDGISIKNMDVFSLRSNIGIVQQETFLFSGTILENLIFGEKNIELQRVIECCKMANAHDFIIKMPNGYYTEVGERGIKLSGGEKQRIAIARAFIRNPKLLILDEPTSALDLENEELIQEALKLLIKNRTTIIIAHRLSTIKNVDKIFVIDNGTVIEEGTHEELLKENTFYKSLFEKLTRF